jgi:hypothetical protein
VNADVMVQPKIVAGSHNIFIAGNDEGPKGQVAELPLWLRLYGATGTPHLNVEILHE